MSSIIAIEGRGYLGTRTTHFGYSIAPLWNVGGSQQSQSITINFGTVQWGQTFFNRRVGTSCEDVNFKRTAPLTQSIGVTFASSPISARHNFAYNYSCNAINPLAFQSIGIYLGIHICPQCL